MEPLKNGPLAMILTIEEIHDFGMGKEQVSFGNIVPLGIPMDLIIRLDIQFITKL
jgi:hypothetical protein